MMTSGTGPRRFHVRTVARTCAMVVRESSSMYTGQSADFARRRATFAQLRFVQIERVQVVQVDAFRRRRHAPDDFVFFHLQGEEPHTVARCGDGGATCHQ